MMRRLSSLFAVLAITLAPGSASAQALNASVNGPPGARVIAALRAGDAGRAADVLIDAVEAIARGARAQRAELRAALARDLEFFAGRAARAEPPSFDVARTAQADLRGGVQNACVAAAELDGRRVTSSAFRTSMVRGAAVTSCAFDTQSEDAFQWTGVVIRTIGAEGLRISVSFASRDAETRRAAGQHLSQIIANLANAAAPAAQQRRRPPPQRQPPRIQRPQPGTTI
jgi:hypothetical protein